MNSRNMFRNTNSPPRWRETVFRTVSGPTDTRNQAKRVHNLLTMGDIRLEAWKKAVYLPVDLSITWMARRPRCCP